MKAALLFLFSSLVLTALGQQTPLFKCFWYNQGITYLKDMGKVDIRSTQKKTIQKVKLWQVDTVQMKITYLQEGVLHDMRIAEVKAIYPC